MRKLLLSLSILAFLCGPAPCFQGSNDCGNAQAIAGTGTFNYDCTAATAGLFGQGNSLCNFAGTPIIESDVWFDWTSDFTGLAVVTTCTGTLDDTKLVAYAGSGCPATNTALACNASACGLQSTIYFSVVSGSSYRIQLGATPGAAPTAPGTFVIREDVPVQYSVNGHHYLPVHEISPWDVARANAEAITYLGVQGHLATYSDLAEDNWVYSNLTGGALGNAWIGLYQDFNDPNFVEPAGGWVWVDGTPLSFTNWYAPSEPNNGGGLEHYGGYWPGNQWNDYQIADANAARYVVEFDTVPSVSFCHGDGTSTACPCSNPGASGEGCANSTGVGALLSTQGAASVVSQSFILTATGMPANQLGLFFQGNNAINSGQGVSFGDGLRCAGGAAKRLQIVNTDQTGATQTTVDVAANGGVVPGDLRRYQLWYGDPGSPCGALFNFSNATEVTWQA